MIIRPTDSSQQDFIPAWKLNKPCTDPNQDLVAFPVCAALAFRNTELTWTINRAQEKTNKQTKRSLTILKCKQSSNFPPRCYGTWSWRVPKTIYLQLWLEHAVGGLVHNPFVTSVITSVRWSGKCFPSHWKPQHQAKLRKQSYWQQNTACIMYVLHALGN